MKQTLIIVVLAGVLIGGGWLLWQQSQVAPVVIDDLDAVITLPPLVSQTFVNEAGEVMTVVIDSVTNSLLLMGSTYDAVTLTAVEGLEGRQFSDEAGVMVANVASDRLTIVVSGNVQFDGVLLPETAQGNPLSETAWYWQQLQLASGEVVVAREPERFKLTFNSDNTLAVSTDCNQQGGPYEVNNNNLLLGTFYSTKMYCEDAQESVYVDALQQVVSYAVSSDILLLQQADGTVLTFTQAAVAE